MTNKATMLLTSKDRAGGPQHDESGDVDPQLGGDERPGLLRVQVGVAKVARDAVVRDPEDRADVQDGEHHEQVEGPELLGARLDPAVERGVPEEPGGVERDAAGHGRHDHQQHVELEPALESRLAVAMHDLAVEAVGDGGVPEDGHEPEHVQRHGLHVAGGRDDAIHVHRERVAEHLGEGQPRVEEREHDHHLLHHGDAAVRTRRDVVVPHDVQAAAERQCAAAQDHRVQRVQLVGREPRVGIGVTTAVGAIAAREHAGRRPVHETVG
ncbi:hypothetical protein ON010_g640 [Phytophthora cinnamomi]|nr:hypothetical protein ON010_g640 [Phytophthora cinnamomi]